MLAAAERLRASFRVAHYSVYLEWSFASTFCVGEMVHMCAEGDQ